MKAYTVFQGPKFTIEWYVDKRGHSQAYEYYMESSEAQQDKAMALFRLMANMGKIWDETKFRNEGDGIYAFKLNQDRYLCFFVKGSKIVITNAFIKKSQKMPPKEKARALNMYNSYSERVKEGIYYGKEN